MINSYGQGEKDELYVYSEELAKELRYVLQNSLSNFISFEISDGLNFLYILSVEHEIFQEIREG